MKKIPVNQLITAASAAGTVYAALNGHDIYASAGAFTAVIFGIDTIGNIVEYCCKK